MKAHNQKMKEFLQTNGIEATPKYLTEGSLKGLWRLYNRNIQWTAELANKLNALGFKDIRGRPLSWLSGNGGMFSVFVQGHNEFLNNGTIIRKETTCGNVTVISFGYKQ